MAPKIGNSAPIFDYDQLNSSPNPHSNYDGPVAVFSKIFSHSTTRFSNMEPTTLQRPTKDKCCRDSMRLFSHDANVVAKIADTSSSYEPLESAMTFVVLPAYNEADGLPSLLERVRRVFSENGRPYHVIVVDDASSDRTPEIAIDASADMPVTLVQHIKNQKFARCTS